MTDRIASVDLRVLGPRARLLGTGDPDSLQNVNTRELPDGAFCWVQDQAAFYVLHKTSAAIPAPPIVITPASGPGRWIQLTSGGGGGIPMPDGTVAFPQGANFINELGLGIYRPAAGLMGLAQGGFLGLQMGNGTQTNVDPNSPSVVRYVLRGFNRPLEGTENETTFAYVRIDPSNADPQQAALYVDITDRQLDTFGPAIKVVHAGHGDAIYVAQFNNGSAYEAASFADGTRGYISTIQVPGTPNSTLFNALWDSASVPNFGMFYADLSTANALTIRERAATAAAGLTQIRIIEELGRQRFGVYNDGAEALSGDVATGGSPNQPSPELRLFGSVWDGAAPHDSAWLVKNITGGAPGTLSTSILAFYQVTAAGTELSMQLASDGIGDDPLLILGSTGLGGLHAAAVQSPVSLGLLTGGGQLAIRLDDPPGGPGHNNETSVQVLRLLDHTGAFTAKVVSQGAPDSAGIGFRSLVVPNDASDDTAIEDTDIALTNWGAAASVNVTPGSTCRRGNLRIIAGAGATNVFTWVLTFPTPFDQVPFAIVMHNDFNTLSDGSQVRVTAVATVNDLTVVGFGDPGAPTPVPASDYHFTWMVME